MAALDWQAVLGTGADLIAWAGVLWASYERFVKPRQKKSDGEGIQAFLFLNVSRPQGDFAQFTLGRTYTDRDAFFDAFVTQVGALRAADGLGDEELIVQLDGQCNRAGAESENDVQCVSGEACMSTEGSDMPDQPKTCQPDKLDLRSLDIAEERQQELLRLFPEVRTEGGKLDFDCLKLTLGEAVDVGKERYGMSWPGKADCFRTIQAPSLGTLRPSPEESVAFDTTENLIIEGDNLEVLKLLQKSYLGKVKMIYIDPPYNTGNDFIYPDNYTESLQTYLEYTGQVDAEGHTARGRRDLHQHRRQRGRQSEEALRRRVRGGQLHCCVRAQASHVDGHGE